MEKNKLIRIIERMDNGEYVFVITKRGCTKIEKDYIGVSKTDKLIHSLACADFYFSIKTKQPDEVRLEEQYYFNHKGRKMSFRPDLLVKLDRWILVEVDLSCRRFESKLIVWEGFYESGVYNKYFEKYPPVVIVSKDIEKVRSIIEKNKKIDLNYVYKDYEEVKNWDYKYDVYLGKVQ